jgi:hypothetical protein
MNRAHRIVVFWVATSALVGCKVGPKYVRPQVPSPPAFKEALPSNVDASAEWKAATPDDQVPRGQWWLIFGDTQL